MSSVRYLLFSNHNPDEVLGNSSDFIKSSLLGRLLIVFAEPFEGDDLFVQVEFEEVADNEDAYTPLSTLTGF